MIPPAPVRCDTCGAAITDEKRLTYYFEVLGVDWANCAACTKWRQDEHGREWFTPEQLAKSDTEDQ